MAEKVFAREGYQGASLERVAREAGVTRQYLNKLFGDKQGLYLACHRRAREQLDQLLLQAGAALPETPSRADARELLRAGAEAYFRFVRDHGSGWDVLFGPGAAIAGPAVQEVERLRTVTVRILASLLTRATPRIDAANAELMAHAMSGAGNQLAKWWRSSDMPIDEIVERYVALFWEGVSPYAPG